MKRQRRQLPNDNALDAVLDLAVTRREEAGATRAEAVAQVRDEILAGGPPALAIFRERVRTLKKDWEALAIKQGLEVKDRHRVAEMFYDIECEVNLLHLQVQAIARKE